jgi:hypothetical protein
MDSVYDIRMLIFEKSIIVIPLICVLLYRARRFNTNAEVFPKYIGQQSHKLIAVNELPGRYALHTAIINFWKMLVNKDISNSKRPELEIAGNNASVINVTAYDPVQNRSIIVIDEERKEGGLEANGPVKAQALELKTTSVVIDRDHQEVSLEITDPVKAKTLELEAVSVVIDYEKKEGRSPEDVSMFDVGYDIKSKDGDLYRAIEVKAKATQGSIAITANEWKAASKLGNSYYLYVVDNISSGKPKLKIIKNPFMKLEPDAVQLQYLLRRDNYLTSAKIVELD